MCVPVVPEQVKSYPVIGLAACQKREGHGFALWTLARYLAEGQGVVSLAALKAATVELRWPAHLWRRALAEAFSGCLLRELNGDHLYLVSLLRVAKRYGTDAGRSPVLVPTAAMRRLTAWKSALWSGWHASRAPRAQAMPISRTSLEQQTGVNPRTQQRLDRKAKLSKTPTFKAATPHPTPVGYVEIVREDTGNRRCFEKDGRVWTQASNIYTSPLSPLPRGACRKVRRALRSALLITHGGHQAQARSYYDTQDKAEAAARKRVGVNGVPTAFQTSVPVFWRFSAPTASPALFLPVG